MRWRVGLADMSKQDDWDQEDRAWRLITLLRAASDEARVEKHFGDEWVIDGLFTERSLSRVVEELSDD